MDKAKDINEFVRVVAQSLEMGACVRYDLKSLAYGDLHEQMCDEYDEYLDMEELPENLAGELRDWEIDLIKDIREILDLPDEIEPPSSWQQFKWMAAFANEQSLGSRFVRDVEWALDSRHPFGAYKRVMSDYDLLDNWYVYREECYCDYVRHELGLPRE